MSVDWNHQAKEYEHRADPARALLWQMRTGKSKSVIDTANFLAQACEIDGVVVVAPNGVHENWIRKQLPKHSTLPYIHHCWQFSNPKNEERAELFLKQMHSDLPWLIINMESLIRKEVRLTLMRFMRRAPNFMVIFDESHHFARPGSKRTSMARALGRKAAYRRILTGTAIENSPLQAFSQFELLEKEALGFRKYSDFKQHHAVYEIGRMKNGQTYPRLSRYEHLDELREKMAKYSSVVLRSDCEDLPPVLEDVRYCALTGPQIRMRRAVKETILQDLEEALLFKPLYGGAALIKLQQIEGGYLKDQNGDIADLCGNDNPKMQALLDEVQQYDGQVIVWFAFTHEIRAAAELMRVNKISFEEFHGKVTDANRTKALKAFEQRKVKVMLGQPKAGGEGRDFSAAGKIIWFSGTPDAIVRSQATERATEMGGESVQLVHFVAPGGVDEMFLDMTNGKIRVADEISKRGLRDLLNSLSF